MKKILYATKTWRGEFNSVLGYHPKADLIIGNNLGFRFVDIGKTKDPYYAPEFEAVRQAGGYEYILWYASDVVPPRGDWIKPALKLLENYPIVSPFWSEDYSAYVDLAKREAKAGFEETEFGFVDHAFSDHAYIAKVRTMWNIDYNVDHPIKDLFPEHGGNSFERRVSQWLAATQQKRAVLKGYQYRHTPRDEK